MKLGIRAKLLTLSLLVILPALFLGYVAARDSLAAVGLGHEQLRRVQGLLEGATALVSLAAIALAMAMSALAAAIASRTARALATSARKLAEGDDRSLELSHAEDEFGELGLALSLLARRYTSALSDLARERDRLRGILTGMREGLLLLDRSRRVALVNPALREMLLLQAEVDGKMLLEVIRHAELVTLFDRAADVAGTASGEIEVGGLKPRRLLVHVVQIAGTEGGLLAVFVDVTHLRRLETLRRDFVANASHELRTPVAAIHSAVETLETALTRDPEGAHDFVAIIGRNAARLKNLVDDLLDLSRIESQDFRVRLEPVDAGELARAVLDLFRERASKRSITLDTTALGECTVLADPRGLEHVLTNLIDNGVKYGGPGSTLTVRSESADDGCVRLVVEDDGPGIEERHLPRLFERFYRVDAGRSRELGGTGLGLSIVKNVSEAMGGSVDVESEPGKGTRFSVTLRRPPGEETR